MESQEPVSPTILSVLSLFHKFHIGLRACRLPLPFEHKPSDQRNSWFWEEYDISGTIYMFKVSSEHYPKTAVRSEKKTLIQGSHGLSEHLRSLPPPS